MVQGDLTKLEVDAIVNAANTTLLGGGGVDGAIHKGAGSELLKACRALGGCPTGDAKITKGYNLPAKFVIHTVGPVWSGGSRKEPELLKSCYQKSFALAEQNNIRSIAFPSISTGAYRYPIGEASRIAIQTTWECTQSSHVIQNVIFVCFKKEDFDIYQANLRTSPI